MTLKTVSCHLHSSSGMEGCKVAGPAFAAGHNRSRLEELLAEVTLLLPILALTFLLGKHNGQLSTNCIRRNSYPLYFQTYLLVQNTLAFWKSW